MIEADKVHGDSYIEQLCRHHVSGQLKLAPEHSEPSVLSLMRKPEIEGVLRFRRKFEEKSRTVGKRQYLTYYFIAAHPGCTESDMIELRKFAQKRLQLNPEQVQIFTPTPSTWATAIWWTGLDPESGNEVFVERREGARQRQKDLLVERLQQRRK